MSTLEYIESGVLELYALGALNEKEQQEVEAMAAKHPEVKDALREAQASVEDLASTTAQEPPAELRSTILSAALGSDAQDSAQVRQISEEPKTESTPKQGRSWLAIAATLLLLVSLGINSLQYQNIQELEDELSTTLIRLATLREDNEVMVTNYREMQESVELLRDTATARFPMQSVEGRPGGYRADVLWNARTETVYLDIKNLPDVAADKQYQLWALQDGKPIDMGVFETDPSGKVLVEMGKVDGADAFAVTLEPLGGSENPTLEEMYVYGTPAAG